MFSIGIVILSAGASSRMGQAKQTLSINGHPLLLHVVDHALSASVKDVVVVFGAKADTLQMLLETYPIQTVVNNEWEKGIGTSIKKGLTELLDISPDLDAVVFMVSDQPLITHEYLGKMIETFTKTKAPIIASSYNGTLGVPVLFAKQEFSKLLSIDDAQGAKSLIMKNVNQAVVLECPEGALDLDTPEDYESFKRQYVSYSS